MSPKIRDSVEDTLKNLIEQFSDVYCFYRELIQNSLDAGTNRIDVYLKFAPGKKGRRNGVVKIHVDDYGEGMNRQIIDNELTRLFSSSKENDLTKIGKFGIGFVSVFAIKPQAVILDTSRDGEDWRIIFNEKKQFERIKRDYPVDGTKITMLKNGSKKFYNNFLKRSRETVEFWCKHSEAEIYFQDERINKPFDVDSPVKIYEKTKAAEIVAGYCDDESPFFGFYNQGLTLMEGRRKFFNRVMFKLKSKYLEHTLTRDNIREDENYFKAMDILTDIVAKKLPEKLFATIEEELKKSKTETKLYKKCLGYALRYMIYREEMPDKCGGRSIARDVEGKFISVDQLLGMSSQKAFLWDIRSNDTTRALMKSGKRVIKCKAGDKLLIVLTRLSTHFWKKNRITRASVAYFKTGVIQNKELTEIQKKLLKSVDSVIHEMGTKTGGCRFADFDYEDSCINDRIYIMQNTPGELAPVSDLDKRGNIFTSLFSLFSKNKTLVLNRSHPYIKQMLELAGAKPDLATYFLSKLLYMDDGVDTETDAKLAMICIDRRE
ncbi:MAG: ATP-binding protein [Candidatus Eremiobacteraeota bacterium]|nr:ATP-binding protein [Candidatus Eremiobacteraeota bacterium]